MKKLNFIVCPLDYFIFLGIHVSATNVWKYSNCLNEDQGSKKN